MESGLNFTILQPSHFLNMFPFQALAQQEKPCWKATYTPSERAFAFTTHEDYAEAAAKVLEEREKHYFAQYPLVSTYPVLYSDILSQASEVIGKKIQVEQVPLDQAIQSGGGASDIRGVEGFERMVLYYNRRGLNGSPTVMEWLLGRKPLESKQWMELQLQKIGKGK